VGDGHRVILRVICENRLEEGHHEDRQVQYRPGRLLEEQLAQASPDLLRELLGTFIQTLLSVEADAVCGAEYGQACPERVDRRNGYRPLDVAIPKLRQGSYFPEWLLERRKRAERALTSVVATCYLLGVSTRRMDRLVASLGHLAEQVASLGDG
jgi:putative transposase